MATLPFDARWPADAPVMTRCECAEMPFPEIVRRAGEERIAPAEAARRAGCGQTCSACVPDLERYLRSL